MTNNKKVIVDKTIENNITVLQLIFYDVWSRQWLVYESNEGGYYITDNIDNIMTDLVEIIALSKQLLTALERAKGACSNEE